MNVVGGFIAIAVAVAIIAGLRGMFALMSKYPIVGTVLMRIFVAAVVLFLSAMIFMIGASFE